MARVRLLHWKALEAATLIRLLSEGGCRVEYDERFAPGLMKQWRESPPDAFVIDLSRLPSQGREVAIALRQSPKTRLTPIIFCNGAEDKVKAIRTALPDALYCSNENLLKAVRSAKPLTKAVKPADMMNRYEGRSLAQKLGIRENGTVALVNPPRDFAAVLGPITERTQLVEGAADVTLCFLDDVDELRSEISRLRSAAASTKLWFLWRKKTAPAHAGVTETVVRETALSLGLVDYKICSVNSTWSAMAFALRKDALRAG